MGAYEKDLTLKVQIGGGKFNKGGKASYGKNPRAITTITNDDADNSSKLQTKRNQTSSDHTTENH